MLLCVLAALGIEMWVEMIDSVRASDIKAGEELHQRGFSLSWELQRDLSNQPVLHNSTYISDCLMFKTV